MPGYPVCTFSVVMSFCLNPSDSVGSWIHLSDRPLLLSNRYSPKQLGMLSIDYISNEDVAFLFFVCESFAVDLAQSHACLLLFMCVFVKEITACGSNKGYTVPPFSPSGQQPADSLW